MKEIVKVRAYWDSQDPTNEGWYATAYARDAAGDLYEADDSMKVWFPVSVEDYDQEQGDDLRAALVAAFPDAEIEIAG